MWVRQHKEAPLWQWDSSIAQLWWLDEPISVIKLHRIIYAPTCTHMHAKSGKI